MYSLHWTALAHVQLTLDSPSPCPAYTGQPSSHVQLTLDSPHTMSSLHWTALAHVQLREATVAGGYGRPAFSYAGQCGALLSDPCICFYHADANPYTQPASSADVTPIMYP